MEHLVEIAKRSGYSQHIARAMKTNSAVCSYTKNSSFDVDAIVSQWSIFFSGIDTSTWYTLPRMRLNPLCLLKTMMLARPI